MWGKESERYSDNWREKENRGGGGGGVCVCKSKYNCIQTYRFNLGSVISF